jgi:molybdenum cofactor biosynthesis protein B
MSRGYEAAMAHSSPRAAHVHVITVSDTRTPEDDESGAACKQACETKGHIVAGYEIVKDDPAQIRSRLASLIGTVDAILLNGGTGIAPRDTTYEAVAGLLERRLDGFGELFRMLSFAEVGSKAMASRAIAGTSGRTLLFSMPGSTKAVRLAMEKLIAPELGHLVGELNK